MAGQKVLFPARAAEDSLESLFAMHGPLRPWIGWLVLTGAISGLIALPLIKVDVAVHASGMVRPATERVDLRPAKSGLIAEVLAHDNDRVHSGQPLIVIKSEDLEERIKRNLELQRDKSELIADLRSITKSALRPSDGTIFGALVELKTEMLKQDRAQLVSQLESNRLAEAKASKELWRYTTLAAKGIAPMQAVDNAQYEESRLQKDSRLIVDQALSRWQSRMRDEELVMADLASEAQRLIEEKQQYTLTAPIDGVLVGFTGLCPGGFVTLGQAFGTVSPDDSLLVETHVAARDVGLVRVGQAARMQVDAFHYTQWGTLDGTVESISGDMISNNSAEQGATSGGVFFKVVVRPIRTTLIHSNGARGDLRKGMTLSARFLIARRSLLQILYEDVSGWLDPKANST